VTSINTYTSVVGISTEDKYLMKSLPENTKYGAQRLLKCFLTKLDSWWTESAGKKIDNTGTVVRLLG